MVERTHEEWQDWLAKDPWNGWRAMVKGEKPPVDPNVPFTGYFRSRQKDKTFVPVAYWKEGDVWKCLIGGRLVEQQRAVDNWPYIARYPIPHAWYVAVAEEGKPWPDADSRVTSAALAASSTPPVDDMDGPGEREVVGGNKPPADETLADIEAQIANAMLGVSDYAKITSDEELAKARSLKNRLTELAGKADKIRKKLKEPHWLAGKAVDTDWMPLVTMATEGATAVNAAENAYATEKLKAQRAAEALARQRQEEAARIQRENETKVQVAEATGDTAELTPVPVVAPAPQPAPEPSTVVRPGYGRAARVKTEWIVTEITDIDALFAFLKTHGEMKTKMMELAQRAVTAGLEPPGVSKEERAKVRG